MPLNTEAEVRALGGLAASVPLAPFLAAAGTLVAGRLAGAYPADELKLVEAYLVLHLQYVARAAAPGSGGNGGRGVVTSRSVDGASESYATPAGLGKGLGASPWGVMLPGLDYKGLLAPVGYATAEWLGDDADAGYATGRYRPGGVR